tara:strand:+ start:463 stop:834 length:372 start_codon:yes stop_codon:yes gene_type:complete
MNFYQVIEQLTPSVGLIVNLVKAFLAGGVAAFVCISGSDFIEDGNDRLVRHVVTTLRDKFAYCFLGSLLAGLMQIASGEEQTFFFVQAITVGGTWPHFVRKLRTKAGVGQFFNSGEQIPVEKK